MTDKELEEVIGKHIYHYHCEEDTWYCCSACPDCCDKDRKGKECDCGREERIKEIATAIRKLLEGR